MGRKRKLTALLAGTTAIVTGFAPAAGQEAPGGLTLTFGISSSIRANDNLGLDDPSPGTTTLWDNRLSFGLLNQTATDTFSFDIDGVLRLSDTPATSDGFDADDYSTGLGYIREGANSRLETSARYSQVDLSFADPIRLILEDINDDGVIDDNDLIIDDGTRRRGAFDFEFETGLNDPFGFGVILEYDLLRYSDTTDPGLFDSDTYSAEVFTRFRLSPVAQGRVAISHEMYEAEDVTQEERETNDVSFGLIYALNPVTTLDTTLGYRDIEETTNVPTVISEEGLFGSIGLTRDLANGTAGVNLNSDLTITGRRHTLSVSRAMELPTGAFAASIGASHSEGSDDTDLIGALEYIHELPRGAISVSLARDAITDDEGDDTDNTSAGVAYTTELTRLSSLMLEFDFVQVEDVTLGMTDTREAATFRATYTRDLTRDWDIAFGYEYRTLDETGANFRDSNEIFVTLEREFTIRR